jgi:phosphatidate phosphatase LPIN
MSYYLGKVGRAGVRLVHSCRELYNDVNAAYLTGAVDVLVVRQRDGSLKSTPFHARFGKLGVLRTGDYKEVEITLNGKEVNLPMIIDETGKIFFTQPRPLQQTSPSMSDDDVGPTNQITGSTSQVTGSVTTGNEMVGTRGNEVATGNDKSAGDSPQFNVFG